MGIEHNNAHRAQTHTEHTTHTHTHCTTQGTEHKAHNTKHKTQLHKPSGSICAIWGPKKPRGAPGARNAQAANGSVIEMYNFGGRRPKPDFEGIWGHLAPSGDPKSPIEPQEPEMLWLLIGV